MVCGSSSGDGVCASIGSIGSLHFGGGGGGGVWGGDKRISWGIRIGGRRGGCECEKWAIL